MQLEGVINGGCILLRTLQPDDATLTYLGWLSDPEINAYLEVRFSPPNSVDALASFIAASNASLDTVLLGIFIQENQRHIGNIKLGPIDWNHLVADIGFLIGDKRQWGRGYASQAISLMGDYAFFHLGLAKLTAGCYSGNEGSRRALLKAGFLEEGRRMSQWFVSGSREDGILMGRVNPGISSPHEFPLTKDILE